MSTLTTPRRHQRALKDLRDDGVRDVRRAAARGNRNAARMLATYQAHAIEAALEAAPLILAEQGLSTASVATVRRDSLLTGGAAAGMMDKADTEQAFDRLTSALVFDAARTAMSVDTATRPAATGFVRQVSPPCCDRCAVLAGRTYRWTSGFQRHPNCDCVMVPSSQALAGDLTTDPKALFEAGQVRGMSRADVRAVNDGADLGRVVNVRRKAAGLKDGTSVMVRGGRPTPHAIYRVAPDKPSALQLLRAHGYVT